MKNHKRLVEATHTKSNAADREPDANSDDAWIFYRKYDFAAWGTTDWKVKMSSTSLA
jgi:hypothetical protein